jgi:uncharacterized RDD family membrane protein YckC
MTFCTACGAENADGTQFCVNCGTSLPPTAPGSWGASGDPGNRASGGLNEPAMGYTPPAYTPQGTPSGALFNQPAGGIAPGQMNYAFWADRVLAALIDGLLVFAAMLVLYLLVFVVGGSLVSLGAATSTSGDSPISFLGSGVCCLGIVLTPIAAILVNLYNKVFLISKRGSSIGQGIMNLRVVMADGGPVPLGTSVLRFLVQLGLGVVPFINFILGLLDLLWPLWDPQRQTLHDKAVGTFVIKTV